MCGRHDDKIHIGRVNGNRAEIARTLAQLFWHTNFQINLADLAGLNGYDAGCVVDTQKALRFQHALVLAQEFDVVLVKRFEFISMSHSRAPGDALQEFIIQRDRAKLAYGDRYVANIADDDLLGDTLSRSIFDDEARRRNFQRQHFGHIKNNRPCASSDFDFATILARWCMCIQSDADRHPLPLTGTQHDGTDSLLDSYWRLLAFRCCGG